MRVMGTLSYVIGPLIGGFLVDNMVLDFKHYFSCHQCFTSLLLLIYYLPKQKIELHIIVPPEEKRDLKLLETELIAYLLFNFFVIGVTVVTITFGIYLD